jgi:hypothetical protein
MKYGPGRHLQSSSRCQRASTRCTGEPHSRQGGEARAIRSAMFTASEPRSRSSAAVQCAPLRISRRSTRRDRPAGTGRSRSLRTARYCSVAHCAACARARKNRQRTASDRQPWPRRSLCVRSSLALSSIKSTLGYRHGARSGIIDGADTRTSLPGDRRKQAGRGRPSPRQPAWLTTARLVVAPRPKRSLSPRGTPPSTPIDGAQTPASPGGAAVRFGPCGAVGARPRRAWRQRSTRARCFR